MRRPRAASLPCGAQRCYRSIGPRWGPWSSREFHRQSLAPAAHDRRGKPPAHAGRAAGTIAARLTFEGVERRYGDAVALARRLARHRPGRGRVPARALGLRQDHAAAHRRRASSGRPAGRVLINDYEVAGPNRFVPPEKRNVGLMFQDFALFPHLTILDNVAFGLKSLPREEARREALAALARVGLERYADDYPHILSGGEQQRVALARAIVPRPAVMLMDEPFSGLDVQLRERLQEETLRAAARDARHLPDRHARARPRPSGSATASPSCAPAGWCRPARPRSSTATRPTCSSPGCSPRSTRSPARCEGGALRTPDRHVRRARARRGRRRHPVHPPPRHPPRRQRGRACPAGCCTRSFLGDLAVLEIAVAGLRAPAAHAGARVARCRRAGRRCRLPSIPTACSCSRPSGPPTMTAKLIGEASGKRLNSSV